MSTLSRRGDGPRDRWAWSVAVVAALVALSAPIPASAATTTTAAAVATSPTTIDLSWSAPTVVVDRWIISMSTTADKAVAGRQTVCGSCFSARLEYLTPGTSYGFVIVGVGGGAGDGVWASAGATTPRDPLCPAPATCVVVDATTSLGPATQPGLGVNYGVTWRTDTARLTPLKLNYHRIAARDDRTFNLVRSIGGEIAVTVNGAWTSWTTATYGEAMDPWDDWTAYRWFVVNLVSWHVQNKLLPEYWEIQNEPDQAAWYTGTTTEPTADLVLRQFQTAHDAIRAVLPTAKIVGPSVGAFDDAAQSVIGIRTFLQYAAEHGLRVDVVAWHELGGDCWGACDAGPRGIAQHMATVRNLLRQYPTLGQPEMHINEFGDPDIYTEPGATVGYFAAMAAAKVQRAASACWPADYDGATYDTCFANPGMINGLLRPDGTTATGRWFVWQAWATMTGTLVAGNVARPDMSVVAVRSSDGTIMALVGRHAPGNAAPDATVPVRVKVPTTTGSYRVTTTFITSDATAETVLGHGAVRAVGGVIDLDSFNVSDGTCLLFTLVPV